MRPIQIRLSALGNSPWVPLNRLQRSFAVALFGYPSSNANLTWKVQHTGDPTDIDAARPVTISRVTTTATVIDPGPNATGHGLSVGDSIQLMGAGAPFDGFYSVATVVDQFTYTYTVANSGLTAAQQGARVHSLRVLDHATLIGQTGRADGNYAFPPTACRLVTTAYVAGYVDLDIIQGRG